MAVGLYREHTLRQRIGGNHIRGRIQGSTFRHTLAAILREELNLNKDGPKKLHAGSESALTAWIQEHLSVAVHPCVSSDALADIERHVLAVLDPPLNLDKVEPTPARARLQSLRRRLTAEDNPYFAAAIGNGRAGYFSVEGDGTRLVWRGPSEDPGAAGVRVEIEPTAATWRSFWRTLDVLDVWQWSGQHYETPGIVDGTYWDMQITKDKRLCRASGANGYPDSSGSEAGSRFAALCRAISRLAGGRTFE